MSREKPRKIGRGLAAAEASETSLEENIGALAIVHMQKMLALL